MGFTVPHPGNFLKIILGSRADMQKLHSCGMFWECLEASHIKMIPATRNLHECNIQSLFQDRIFAVGYSRGYLEQVLKDFEQAAAGMERLIDLLDSD